MKETAVVLLCTVLYIILTYVVIALFKVRDRKKAGRGETKEEFMSAKGTLGFIAALGLIVGNLVTSDYTVALVQSVYLQGASALWLFICWQIANVLFGIFMVPLYRTMLYKHGCTSVTEALSKLFDKRVSKLVAIITAIAFVATFAGGPLAIAALLAPMTGISYNIIYWGSVVIFIIIAVFGGLKGIARANVMHAVIMFLSMLTLLICCMHSVDFSAMMHAIPFEMKNPWNMPFSDLFSTFITQSCCGFVSALLASAAMGSKKTKTAQAAVFTASGYVIVYVVMVCFIGFTVKFLMPEIDSSAAFYQICHKFGSVMTAFGAVATFAAIMSSAPTLLMVGCNGLVEELYVKTRKDASEVSDKKTMLITRVLIVVVGIAMPFICQNVPTILTITSNAWTIMGAMGIFLGASLLWKRPGTTATFWGMMVGSVICVIWVFAYLITGAYPLGISAAYASIIPGLVVMIVLAFVTEKSKRAPMWDAYIEARKEMKEEIKAGRF